jgi:phosphatidylinositol alpha-1,6-mannosyltransferase
MKRKPKYLLVTTDFPPGVGGVQRLLAGLCEGLSRNADVSIVALINARNKPVQVGRIGVTYVPVSSAKIITMAMLTLTALLKTHGKDMIICGHINAGLPAFLAEIVFRKPYVVYIHAMEVTNRKWKYLYKVILKHATRIVTGSSYSKSLVRRLFGLECVDVIHPSVDVDFPERKPAPPNEEGAVTRKETKVILTVGRIDAEERYKGHDTVIEAMRLVLGSIPNAEYWVVGDGTDRPRLEAVARETGVGRAVRFFGQVQDVTPFYEECDVFVMVAETIDDGTVIKGEGFGLVYIEAASFGKPIIAGDCGGATDAVIDDCTGFLIPPKEPGILADRLVYLLKNPDVAKAMGQRAKKRVLTHFNHGRQLDEFENVLAETLSLR